MQTTQQIIKQTNQKSKIGNESTTKKVINAFLATIQQKLIQGESVSFKGFFTLKRTSTKPKGSKYCSKHEKSLTDYKQANKGKGLAAFAKSGKFRELVSEAKKCKDCQNKKQQLLKLVKLTNRILLKPGKEFWTVKSSGKRR